ncbi:MAG TPA: glycosyltransferase [Bryobacteraceae bacterium]|nr:glycosyltransferase [Bryobacteraceae bacterium]
MMCPGEQRRVAEHMLKSFVRHFAASVFMSTKPATRKETPPPAPASPWGPEALRERNLNTRRLQAEQAPLRKEWIRRNRYYYRILTRALQHVVEPGKRVLNICCETGFLLHALRPAYGVGVEISPEMTGAARTEHPQYSYAESFPEEYTPAETFDYVLLNNVNEIADVQRALSRIRLACERHTRLLIYNYNHLWEPVLRLAQALHLKIPQVDQNWLSEKDLVGLFGLTGFEWLKTYRVALFPKYIPLLSAFLNRFVAKLPLLQRMCMVEILVARPNPAPMDPARLKVSVVIPCKDERGNVEDAVRRIPPLGGATEIVFCDDKSTDGTADEVRRMQAIYPDRDIKLVDGPGICKSRNVWTGFEHATGDILMILDADLTVMPEELPYFLDAIARSGVEFVNGSRLIYPVPKAAMKNANMLGNKLFSSAFSYLLGQRIKDTLCGTKVLWRSDWERIRPMIGTWGTVDRWGDYDLLFGAAKLNLRIADLPVHYQERIYGVTKMTKVFKNGLIMAGMCVHGFRKLKLGY